MLSLLRRAGQAAVLITLMTQAAFAGVGIRVDLSRQLMTVTVDGAPYANWAVSTARPGYRTPAGIYHPYSLDRMHYSSRYDWTPMPHSIFFSGNYAIHGSYEVRRLGRPVSHGCIRLRPDHARMLFYLVGHHGLQNTTISVVE